jgi:ribosomal protein S27E
MPEALTCCPSCGGEQEVYEDPEDGSVEVYCADCVGVALPPRDEEE